MRMPDENAEELRRSLEYFDRTKAITGGRMTLADRFWRALAVRLLRNHDRNSSHGLNRTINK